MLYVGLLADFHFDPAGHLDRLVLENVARRPFADDKDVAKTLDELADDEGRFYWVEGKYFVIRYAEVITLNVKYIRLPEAAETDAG